MTRSTSALVFTTILAVVLFAGFSSPGQAVAATVQQTGQQEAGDEEGMSRYSEVITDEAESDEGLFTVHNIDDTYYYEIPDSLLGREMLVVSRIAKTQNNLGYGGEKNNTQTVRWQRKGDNILLRHVSYENVADSSLAIYQAVRNSNFEPIISTFPVESLGEESSGVVIDVTSLYNTDVPAFGLDNDERQSLQVRSLDGDRTFIEHIRSYPENIEARSLLTYDAGSPASSSQTGTVSLVMNHSMVLLPADPARTRAHDRRIGFSSVEQVDYGADAQRAKEVRHIIHYELVPSDKEAYMNGELVEPVEPIVYWIDPATPEKWRPYLKQGIEDWNVAFENAGFKNAIIAKDPPVNDPDWSPEDARYSVIRYFASPTQNAYGPEVHDPRTGQILESDIGWYHNVMNLLRNWYFVHTAAANPKARGIEFDDAVMGELIRFVSAHEVGHTLGMPHNHGSSFAYSVEDLRSPEFTSTHGTAPSILDYARFNFVAQPGDGVTNFLPAIGTYDSWAIKWAYTWFPDSWSDERIQNTLNEWTRERADDPRYFFGTGDNDPRVQTEDLTNDAMRASELGVANLERIVNNLIEWTERDGANYAHLEELYGEVVGQWEEYLGHVSTNVGGVYQDDKTHSQEGVVFEFVSEERQRRAMEWLAEYGWGSPSWMLNYEVLDRINESTVVDDIRSAQTDLLDDVADPEMLGRLIEWETRSDGDTYTAFELMDDLRSSIWSELESGSPQIGVFRRNLQRGYVERMEFLMGQETAHIRPMVREQLQVLLDEVEGAVDGAADRSTQVHLEDVTRRIEDALDAD